MGRQSNKRNHKKRLGWLYFPQVLGLSSDSGRAPQRGAEIPRGASGSPGMCCLLCQSLAPALSSCQELAGTRALSEKSADGNKRFSCLLRFVEKQTENPPFLHLEHRKPKFKEVFPWRGEKGAPRDPTSSPAGHPALPLSRSGLLWVLSALDSRRKTRNFCRNS